MGQFIHPRSYSKLPKWTQGTEQSSCFLHKQVLLIHLNLWVEMWLDQGKKPRLPFLLHLGRRKRHYFLLLERLPAVTIALPHLRVIISSTIKPGHGESKAYREAQVFLPFLFFGSLPLQTRANFVHIQNHTELSFHLAASQLYLTFSAIPVVYKALNMHKQNSKQLLNTLITVLINFL